MLVLLSTDLVLFTLLPSGIMAFFLFSSPPRSCDIDFAFRRDLEHFFFPAAMIQVCIIVTSAAIFS